MIESLRLAERGENEIGCAIMMITVVIIKIKVIMTTIIMIPIVIMVQNSVWLGTARILRKVLDM